MVNVMWRNGLQTMLAVLLVGGGNVAHEKISRLVDAEADVTVVAPDLIPAVREYIDRGLLGLHVLPIQGPAAGPTVRYSGSRRHAACVPCS